MKKILAFIALVLPTFTFAAQYTGHITKISINAKGDTLVFETANKEETCESNWFTITKSTSKEISPVDFITQAYFSNKKITIHASQVCAPLSEPATVERVTLGTSTEEVKALIQQIREKRKLENKPSNK